VRAAGLTICVDSMSSLNTCPKFFWWLDLMNSV
jgi:hypothetical protein